MYKYLGLLVAFAAQPALAQEYRSHGIRAEIRIGYETPTISDTGVTYKFGNSASAGGELGYDIAVGNLTAGAFANYDFSRAATCDTTACVGSNGNFAAGMRLALVVGERDQIYVKVGYDLMKVKATVGTLSSTDYVDGVMLAAGYNHALTERTYIGVEASYAKLGSIAGDKIARRHVAVTGGARF